jgi:hypothetical protein
MSDGNGEAPIDTSKSARITVGRRGEMIVLQFEEFYYGIPSGTAREIAETILALVAAIEGKECFLISMGSDPPKTVWKAK